MRSPILGAMRGGLLGKSVGVWGCGVGLMFAVSVFAETVSIPRSAVAPFKAMVIHPVGQFAYHTHDLDYGLNQNGIAFQLYGADNPDAIRSDLDQYDLVLCTPLVNLNEVLGGAEDAVRAWIGRGNAFVVTDGCDGRLYNPWLATVSSVTNGIADAGACGSVGSFKHSFILDTDPPHPLRCFPEKLDFESLQWNALRAGPEWETVSTCSGLSPAMPVTVVRPLGRGLLYLSSMQQRWSSLPANLVANLRLRRMGLAPVSYSLTPPGQGVGTLRLAVKSLDKPTPVQFRLQLTPAATNARPFWTLSPVKQPDGKGGIDANLAFEVARTCEGPAFLSFEIRTPQSDWVTIFRKPFDIPPALTVCPPRYRGVLSEDRRTKDVGFEVLGAANDPKAMLTAAQVSVYDPAGKQLGVGTVNLPTTNRSPSILVSVPLPKLKAGDGYVVKAMGRLGNGTVERASTNFTVRASAGHPGDTLIDEDLTLLVDGKPFFPLGIYHLGPEEYPQVTELGFNTVGTLQWMTRNRESLDAAQALGLKVLFENNEKELGGHWYLPGFLRDHPALLLWYAPDEPLHEVDSQFAMNVTDIYRKGDPFHPTICVDFNIPRFALNARCSDIFACEYYLLNREGGETPIGMEVDLLNITRDAVRGRKPVFVVPRAIGGEKDYDERAVAWLALTHDVRGLFWYAWNEGNNVGLKYDTTLQEGMRALLSQLRELTPALTAPVRRPFVAGSIHGIVCDDGETRTLLVVNIGKEAAAIPPIPEFQKRTPEALFGGGALTESLSPLECRAYRCRAVSGAGSIR